MGALGMRNEGRCCLAVFRAGEVCCCVYLNVHINQVLRFINLYKHKQEIRKSLEVVE